MIDLKKLIGFEWDKGNVDKSYNKHGINPNTAEEVFLDEEILLLEDEVHSQTEVRFKAIGKILKGEILLIVFTVRETNIRIISARRANQKEGGYMNKNLKPIPDFNTEAEEREFWQTHDSTEYLDWSKAQRGVQFPNLKLTSKPITLRLPVSLIDRVKIEAHKMDIPYQALIKKLIFEGISK